MRMSVGCSLILAAACGGSNPTGGGSGTPPPPVRNVVMSEYSFTPKDVTIKAGTRVTWTNNGTTDHTATSDSPGWDSGSLSPPQPIASCPYPPCGTTPPGAYTFTLTTAGTYPYHCSFHGTTNGMTGTITVTP